MTSTSSPLGLQEVDAAPPPLVEGLLELLRREAPPGDADAHPFVARYSEDELVAALVALAPEALELHRRAGVPAEVTSATLLDVGRKHELYGAGTVLPWLLGLMRADVVELGRLQVERQPDERGHALHIPETGPLAASVVDDSLERIRALTGGMPLHCTSWMLDPVVVECLPGTNLASFAGRFEIIDGGAPTDADAGNRAVAKFVFGASCEAVLDVRTTEPSTRLERLVVDRLRHGYRWSEPFGVLAAG